MKRKGMFWLFIAIGLICGTASYFINDEKEAVSASNYTIYSGNGSVGTVPAEERIIQPGSATLVLVNEDHPLDPIPSQDSPDLVNVVQNQSYKIKDRQILLTSDCLEAFNRMMKDFQAATGKHDVIILSGYRSAEQQQELLNRAVLKGGVDQAEKLVAPVGGSEHHTGLAMDLGIYTDGGQSKKFRAKGAYSWLAENMYRYGFIVRYRDEKSTVTGITDEPWHIRYVGVPHAGMMEQLDFCLEEYIDYLQGFTASGQHLFANGDNHQYEIFTIPAGEAVRGVPDGAKYCLSEDNLGNYIITADVT